MTHQGFPISRRRFVQGSVAAAAAAGAGWPVIVEAAGDTLRVRNYSDLQILDPAYLLSAPEWDILRCMFHGLITYVPGDDWKWELDAAEMIAQGDDTHIKFGLRSGIGWTNGFGEMTAEDVKFSYERIADPAMESPYAEDWSALDHVEVTERYAGTIVLKEAYAPLWTTTLPVASGIILCKAAVEQLEGKRYTAEVPAWSGPYDLTEWVPNQKTVLRRREDYTAGPKPDFATIEVRPINDENAAELGVISGDLDYSTIAVSSLANLREDLPAGLQLVEKPSLKYVWMGINGDNPKFKDIRVRKAIQMAVNVEQILEAAYFGLAGPATGIIPPGLIGHRDAPLIPYAGDKQKARDLLVQAGHGGGLDVGMGVLNKQTFLTAAQVIQANLAEIGVNMEITSYDSGVWWTMGMESEGESWKTLEVMYSRFSSNPDPGWYTMWFTPKQVGVWNWERFNDAEFGDLHAKALVESDPAERDRMYKRMQDLMEESGMYRFITHELTAGLFSKSIVPALLPDGSMIWKEFKKA